MALPPLNLRITGDTTGLDSALGIAQRNARRAAVAITAALGAVGVALVDQTRRGLQFADSQVKAARAMEGTADGLRALQLAGKDAGVSVQSMTRDLQTITRELARAASEGGPAADALETIGLRASDLADMDIDQRLAVISDRMRAMGLSAGQANRVMQQLGVRNREFALLMLQGGDAIRSAREEIEDFGLSIDREMGQQIEAANDAMSRIGLVFERLQLQLARNMAPVLQNMAERFTAMARTGGPLASAIDQIAAAFASLAENIMTDEAVDALSTAFTGLIGVVEGVVNGVVFMTNNVELMTVAFTGAAVAVAALGGPLTMVVGLLGGAALGFATMRRRAGETRDTLNAFRRAAENSEHAQVALNNALGRFHETRAPAAVGEALRLAESLEQEARAAVLAAEAHIQLTKARAMEMGGSQQDIEDRTDALRRQSEEVLRPLREDLENASRTVQALRRTIHEGGGITIPGAPSDDDEIEGDIIAPGLSGAGRLSDDLAERLEVLQQGLMTEQEVVQEFYDQGMELLREAREEGLLTEQEYMELRERLEEEHQNRLNAIRDAGNESALSSIVSTGQEILSAIGQNNRKAAQAAQALGQFEAMVNAFRAASQVLADPTVPWWQKISAAGTALASGIGFANSISNMSLDGGGAGGRRGGVGVGGAASSAPTSIPVQRMVIETQGGGMIPQQSLGSLIEQINEAGRRGHRIEAEFIGAR